MRIPRSWHVRAEKRARLSGMPRRLLNVRPRIWRHTVRPVAGTARGGQVRPDPYWPWPILTEEQMREPWLTGLGGSEWTQSFRGDPVVGVTGMGKTALYRELLDRAKLGPHEYVYWPRTSAFIEEVEQRLARMRFIECVEPDENGDYVCTHPIGYPLTTPLNSNSEPRCPLCGGRP